MYNRRIKLREKLYEIAGRDNVYYEPASNVRLKYPCIVYKLSNLNNQHADNIPYIQFLRYEVTVMDKNPDSEISEAISKLPACSFVNSYVVENIHHTIYQIFV